MSDLYKVLAYLGMAKAAAQMSKDTAAKVGALVLGPGLEIRSTGRNDMPRRVDESRPERHVKPEKFYWYAHAEENAVAQAARTGAVLQGCTILVTELFPCTTCARLIIQSGIVRVVAPQPDSEFSQRWLEESKRSIVMLQEAGVEITHYPRSST